MKLTLMLACEVDVDADIEAVGMKTDIEADIVVATTNDNP